MKDNKTTITGVHHYKKSAQKYHLRRFLPDAPCNNIVDQFWLVNWHFSEHDSHTQQNLPDPNIHLVIENNQIKLIGPVSKSYTYKMTGSGRVIGVKFHLGVLSSWLGEPIANFVDKEICLKSRLTINLDKLAIKLTAIASDEELITVLFRYLKPFSKKPNADEMNVRQIIELTKHDDEINTVEDLATRSNLSVRTIQRYLKTYVGLSPKWIIRKYRLHQALAILEADEVNVLDVVERLGYTDQSHLIRDFKELIGKTPTNYLNQKP